MERWLVWLANTVAPETRTNYAYHVRGLVKWLEGRGTELEWATTEQLLEYAAEARERWSPSTVKGAVCAMRSFYWWRFRDASPAQFVPLPAVPRRKQRYPSAESLGLVLASCDTATARGRRDVALLYLMLDTGLRASEVCRLRLDCVDLAVRTLSVVIKGGNEAAGAFGEVTANALMGWLADRARWARPDCATLFCSVGGNAPGGALTRDGLRAIFRRMATAAGLVGFSPHDMRRAFCVGMLRRGAPTELVRRAGRWANVAIVQRYSDDLNASDVAGYSPVDGLFA